MTYTRPPLTVREPNRAVGGFYRIAPGQKGGKIFGGVPLQTTEDAVVAAVRTGYRIADAQIERGMKIAQQLRGAAKRAGAGEPKDMLLSAESLATRGIALIVEWLETQAAQPSSPLKRMLSAEYRLLGSLLGLGPDAANDLEAKIREIFKQGDGQASATESSARAGVPPTVAHPVIVFDGEPRAVELIKWELSGEVAGVTLKPLKFARAGDPGSTFDGRVEYRADDGALVLTLTLSAQTAEGRWKAAICGTNNVLVGIVIVEL
jgi:hypothetical protein